MEEEVTNIHQELIDRSLRGDGSAQGKLYSLYSKAMYNTSLRIVGDSADAEDVLQDAFVNAFKKLHTYQATATFGAWLKKIVVNRAINHVKRRRLEFSTLEIDRHDFATEAETVDYPLSVAVVKDAIDELPDGYRVVFCLYLLEGYDHKEISEILKISVSTSKSQYNRAKKKLKEILKEKANG